MSTSTRSSSAIAAVRCRHRTLQQWLKPSYNKTPVPKNGGFYYVLIGLRRVNE